MYLLQWVWNCWSLDVTYHIASWLDIVSWLDILLCIRCCVICPWQVECLTVAGDMMACLSNRTQIFQLLSFGSHNWPYSLQLWLLPALHLAQNNICAVSSRQQTLHRPLAVCIKLEGPVMSLAKLWYWFLSNFINSISSVIYNHPLSVRLCSCANRKCQIDVRIKL